MIINLTKIKNYIVYSKDSMRFNYKMLDAKTQENIGVTTKLVTTVALVLVFREAYILTNIATAKAYSLAMTDAQAISGLGSNLGEAVEIGISGLMMGL